MCEVIRQVFPDHGHLPPCGFFVLPQASCAPRSPARMAKSSGLRLQPFQRTRNSSYSHTLARTRWPPAGAGSTNDWGIRHPPVELGRDEDSRRNEKSDRGARRGKGGEKDGIELDIDVEGFVQMLGHPCLSAPYETYGGALE